jgi:hypothetical protein
VFHITIPRNDIHVAAMGTMVPDSMGNGSLLGSCPQDASPRRLSASASVRSSTCVYRKPYPSRR